MRIVILDQDLTQHPNETFDLSALEALGELEIFFGTTSDRILERVKNADVLILNKVVISRQIIEQFEGVKLIALTATGYDNVDIHAAREQGISVANVAGYSTDAVTQLTLLFLLALARNLPYHMTNTRNKQWKQDLRFACKDYELQGKTLGIIGFGTIGKNVANIARALGMKVIVSTPHAKEYPGVTFVDTEELARTADYITIHCLLNNQTRNLIDAAFLANMKSTAYLINTSRGGVVDEAALIEVLREKKIAGAALDVLVQEPPDPENPLLTMDNVIVTPHIAWTPHETRQRLLNEVAENIKSFFAGNPRNIVN